MLQVIGTSKSKDTQKAVRYLKERNIPFQFVDLTKYSLSPREWKSILSSVSDTGDIIDKNSQYYKKNGYAWREYDPAEEAMLHPELLLLPVLRKDGRAVVGWNDENPEVLL